MAWQLVWGSAVATQAAGHFRSHTNALLIKPRNVEEEKETHGRKKATHTSAVGSLVGFFEGDADGPSVGNAIGLDVGLSVGCLWDKSNES